MGLVYISVYLLLICFLLMLYFPIFYLCISVDIYVYILHTYLYNIFLVYMIESTFSPACDQDLGGQFMQMEAGPSALFSKFACLIKIIC